MVDIQALPIAIALTVWDAAPIFLSVGLALAVLTRVTLPRQGFHTVWRWREVAGIEGILYAAIFQPVLVPVLVIVALGASVLALKLPDSTNDVPSTPGRAVSMRTGELMSALLVGSVLAAVVKIATPSMPENFVFQALIAVVTGIIVGRRSGAAAIPAVAIAVHAGGVLPAMLCIAATLIRPAVFAWRGGHLSPAGKNP